MINDVFEDGDGWGVISGQFFGSHMDDDFGVVGEGSLNDGLDEGAFG